MKTIQNTFLIISVLALISCTSGKRNPLENLEQLNGKKFKGGSFYYNEVEYLKTLYPHNITEVVGSRIATQIYEGLYTLKPQELIPELCLAESVEIDSSQTIYSFKIKRGILFHKNKCFKDGETREVKPSDFKYCFDKMCEKSANSQSGYLFKEKVVGAKEYYESTSNKTPLSEGVSGIVADDNNYTLTITLIRPFASFKYILAMPNLGVFPKEALDFYGDEMRINCVGTGPFVIEEGNLKEEEKVILTRNNDYWGKDTHGNQLPYLSSVQVSFVKENKLALLDFKKGQLDLMYKMPLEMFDQIVDRSSGNLKKGYKQFKLDKNPTMALWYLGFQHHKNLKLL